MTCGSRIFSACAVLTPNGNFCVVHPKTVCRISHHLGPTGISALTVPTAFPLASSSAICRSPSISTFTATTRPVSANQLFSIPVRSELCVKCSADPRQLNTSEGVTACIALASAGGVEGSGLSEDYVFDDFEFALDLLAMIS